MSDTTDQDLPQRQDNQPSQQTIPDDPAEYTPTIESDTPFLGQDVFTTTHNPEQSSANLDDGSQEVTPQSAATTHLRDATSNAPVAVKGMKADITTVIGQLNISNTESQIVKLMPIKDDFIQRSVQLFVYPDGYAENRKNFIENLEARIVIIFGSSHAGKLTTAINLGMDVISSRSSKKTRFTLCRNIKKSSLIDILQQKEMGESQVYIIENAFESGIDINEIGGPQLRHITEILEQKKSFLLLTTSRDKDGLGAVEVDLISAVVTDLRTVLSKHLDRYAARDSLDVLEESFIPDTLYDLVHTKSEQLLEYLKNPFLISRFCAHLSRKEANDEAILRFAQEVASIDSKPVAQWWQGLNLNEQLYAMLVFLFAGVDRQTLDEIYDESVRYLREDGLRHLIDPRRFGRDEMLERIYAYDDASIIKFNHAQFVREVRRQVRNHHSLLWSLHSLILKLVVKFRDADYRYIHQVFGSALGRMGIHNLIKLEQFLLYLIEYEDSDDDSEESKYEEDGVFAIVSYTLNEICDFGTEYYDFIGNIIENWADSEYYWYMRVVGSSISRVYDTVVETTRTSVPRSTRTDQADTLRKRLFASLSKLASTCDQFNHKTFIHTLIRLLPTEEQSQEIRSQKEALIVSFQIAKRLQKDLDEKTSIIANSILRSIRQIAQTNMVDIVSELIKWLAHDGKDLQQILAILASNQLFNIGGDHSIYPYKVRHLPLLNLIEPLFEQYTHWYAKDNQNSQIVVQALSNGFRMIRTWLVGFDWTGRDEERLFWQNHAYTVLLRVATHADAVSSALLRDLALKDLVDDLAQPPDCARVIGQALVARVSLMRGFPSFMPGCRSITMLIDGSVKGLAGNRGVQLGWQLFTHLDPHIDTYLYQMGNMARLAQPGEPLSAYVPAARPLPYDATTEAVQFGSGAARVNHALARLVVPQLEVIDVERTLCALILAWDIPDDIEDLQESPWSRRLLLVSETSISNLTLMDYEPWTRLLMGHVRLDRLTNDEKNITIISKEVRTRIAQMLLETTPAILWEALEPYLVVDYNDRAAIESLLTTWANNLVDSEDLNYRNSRLRLITCTVFWLAISDLTACVGLLEFWLKHDSITVRRCGQACTRMLFAVYAEKSDPPIDTFAQILKLVPYLSDQGWEDARVVFDAVRVWARSETWCNHLMTSDHGEGEFMLLVSRLAEKETVRKQILDYLAQQEWIRPKDRRYGKSPDSVLRLGEQIALRAELGVLDKSSMIASDTRYGLVIVDASIPVGSNIRIRIAETCSKLLTSLAEEPIGDNLTFLALRLGQAVPFAIATEKPAPKLILPDGIGRLPRIIGPLLENFQLNQISFILLMTAGELHDEDDWREHEIASRIHVAAFQSAISQVSFTPINLGKNLIDTSDVSGNIFHHLKSKIGVASWDVSSALSA